MTPEAVDYASYWKIPDVNAAVRYFEDSLRVSLEILGAPLMVGLTFSVFPNAIGRYAEVCAGISPKWLVSMIGNLMVENPFEHPGYEAVYPYKWHSVRTGDKLKDKFLDFQVSIEHHADGKTNLLLHTNHPIEWLNEGLEELGLASQSVELRQNEIYADLDAIARDAHCVSDPHTPRTSINWPVLELDESMSMDAVVAEMQKAFEANGIYLHPHATFDPLGNLGRMFSCHEDRRNDVLIVRAAPWNDSDATKLGLAISGLLENVGPFGTTSLAIISTLKLPPSLQTYQYPADVG